MNQTIQPPRAQALLRKPLYQLRKICQSGLLAGSIWRPSVVALERGGQWYWRDVRETGGGLCGPFPSERDALCNAIHELGTEEAPATGISSDSAGRSKSGVEEFETEVLLEELRRRGAQVSPGSTCADWAKDKSQTASEGPEAAPATEQLMPPPEQEDSSESWNFRIRVDDSHNPKGPDGRGWNRLAIMGLGSHDRCVLRPLTRQGALDTLRGMARFGVPSVYADCQYSGPCNRCPIAARSLEPWNAQWHIREDANGRVWLLGNVSKGFAGFGYSYRDWEALMASVAVPMLSRRRDDQGFYWVAE